MFLLLPILFSGSFQAQNYEFEAPKYINVQFALPDGTPDRKKPVNSWQEVRRSRRLVFSYTNGVETPQKTSFRIGMIGSVQIQDSSPLPPMAVPFSLPSPNEPVLHINRPRNCYVITNKEVPAKQTLLIYSIAESRYEVEFRFLGGKEYLRWRSTESIVGYEEQSLPLNRS